MVLEIFKIHKITGDNLHRHRDRTYNYKLDINIPNDEAIVLKVEKIIIKTINPETIEIICCHPANAKLIPIAPKINPNKI